VGGTEKTAKVVAFTSSTLILYVFILKTGFLCQYEVFLKLLHFVLLSEKLNHVIYLVK